MIISTMKQSVKNYTGSYLNNFRNYIRNERV